jgi:hypothetical protein
MYMLLLDPSHVQEYWVRHCYMAVAGKACDREYGEVKWMPKRWERRWHKDVQSYNTNGKTGVFECFI